VIILKVMDFLLQIFCIYRFNNFLHASYEC